MPERAIVFRLGRVLGTSMPETAVHEHGQSCLPENEIRLAENGLTTTPAGDALPPQQSRQRQFCIPVAVRTNPRHDLRTLGFCINITHPPDDATTALRQRQGYL